MQRRRIVACTHFSRLETFGGTVYHAEKFEQINEI